MLRSEVIFFLHNVYMKYRVTVLFTFISESLFLCVCVCVGGGGVHKCTCLKI